MCGTDPRLNEPLDDEVPDITNSYLYLIFIFLDRRKNDVVMIQMVKRERFPLLRTSLLKMHKFPLFPGGASELLAVLRTHLNVRKKIKSGGTLNYDF